MEERNNQVATQALNNLATSVNAEIRDGLIDAHRQSKSNLTSAIKTSKALLLKQEEEIFKELSSKAEFNKLVTQKINTSSDLKLDKLGPEDKLQAFYKSYLGKKVDMTIGNTNFVGKLPDSLGDFTEDMKQAILHGFLSEKGNRDEVKALAILYNPLNEFDVAYFALASLEENLKGVNKNSDIKDFQKNNENLFSHIQKAYDIVEQTRKEFDKEVEKIGGRALSQAMKNISEAMKAVFIYTALALSTFLAINTVLVSLPAMVSLIGTSSFAAAATVTAYSALSSAIGFIAALVANKDLNLLSRESPTLPRQQEHNKNFIEVVNAHIDNLKIRGGHFLDAIKTWLNLPSKLKLNEVEINQVKEKGVEQKGSLDKVKISDAFKNVEKNFEEFCDKHESAKVAPPDKTKEFKSHMPPEEEPSSSPLGMSRR